MFGGKKSMFIRPHAVDRYREYHPEAGLYDVRLAIASATEASRGVIAQMCGTWRMKDRAKRDRYFIPRTLDGVFVVVPTRPGTYRQPWLCKTFLRFSLPQQRAAQRYWGTDEPLDVSGLLRESSYG